MKIVEQLNKYLSDYEKDADITEHYSFNFKKTINKIELYNASKFISGDTDSQGNHKYFENIANPQCGNATKNIDLDRKNIEVHSNNGKDRLKAMIYNNELKYWMRKANIGVLLNKIVENLPKYGSVVLKKVGKDIKMIPLKQLIFDPAVSNIDNDFDIKSSYIVQEHNYSVRELEKEKKWDKKKIKEIAKKMRRARENEITVYEVYAEMENKYIKGVSGKGYSLGMAVVCDDEVLYTHKIKKFPYKKVDYLTIEGRALGLGIIEMLFDPQRRWNEMCNQKALSMKLGSKHIYQSRDTTVASNVMTDLLDGEILKVNSEITPISTEERNLGAYNQEESKLMSVIRSLANAHEIMTGESLPSRTPFRLGALMNQNAGKLFEFIRENLSLFLEEVINEWVLPQFEAGIVKEHIFEFYDAKTIRLLVERDVNRRLNIAIKNYVISSGEYPTKEEVDMLKETLLSQHNDTEFAKMVEGYLDFDKTLIVDISGESTNRTVELESMTNFMQLLGQNPILLQDPQFRPMMEEIAGKIGINPTLIPEGQPTAMPPLNASGKPMPNQPNK